MRQRNFHYIYNQLPLPHDETALSGPGPSLHQDFTTTLRHTTLSRTALDELSARRRDLYVSKQQTYKRHPSTQWYSNPQFQQTSGRKPIP